jgi:hypothetical protein
LRPEIAEMKSAEGKSLPRFSFDSKYSFWQ